MNRAFLLSLGTLLLGMSTVSALQLENAAFRVSVMGSDDGVLANVEDLAGKRTLADRRYYYHAVREGEKGRAYSLENAAVTAGRGTIVIRGRLAGLEVEQVLSLPADRPILEERIRLRNGTQSAVALDSSLFRAANAPWEALQTFAREKGKSLLATECCWGTLDDARRVAIIDSDLETIRGQRVGFLAHALHENYVADLHRPQHGIISSAEYMAFIHMDSSLQAGHEVFNSYAPSAQNVRCQRVQTQRPDAHPRQKHRYEEARPECVYELVLDRRSGNGGEWALRSEH